MTSKSDCTGVGVYRDRRRHLLSPIHTEKIKKGGIGYGKILKKNKKGIAVYQSAREKIFMELPIVKIINSNKRITKTQCYVDDFRIPKVQSVDFHVSLEEVPIFTFKTIGLPDIDMAGDVSFKFHPRTVVEAVKVVHHELLHDKTFYDGFLASIESALNEAKPYTKEHDLAVAILNRLIGEK